MKDFLIEELLGLNPFVDAVPDPNRRQLLERVAAANVFDARLIEYVQGSA